MDAMDTARVVLFGARIWDTSAVDTKRGWWSWEERRHYVFCGWPMRTSGGPFFVKRHRDRNYLRHDRNISLQGCGMIGGRC